MNNAMRITAMCQWLASNLGVSENAVREMEEEIYENGHCLRDAVSINPMPNVEGTATQVEIYCKEDSFEISIDSCQIVLKNQAVGTQLLIEQGADDGHLLVDVRELIVVLVHPTNLIQLHKSISELANLAACVTVEKLVVVNTRGEEQAAAGRFSRTGTQWTADNVHVFGGMKFESVDGTGSDCTGRKMMSIPSSWGWHLDEPVDRVSFEFLETSALIKWLGNVKLSYIQNRGPPSARFYSHVSLEGEAATLNFEDWQVECKSVKLCSEEDAIHGMIRIRCFSAVVKDFVELTNVEFSGSIENGSSGINICLVSIDRILLRANEFTQEWLDSLIQSSIVSNLDTVQTPYAKVGQIKCVLDMPIIEQAAAGLPFLSIPKQDFEYEAMLGGIVRLYALILSEVINDRRQIARETKVGVSDSIVALFGRMALNVGTATPIGLVTSCAAVRASDGVAAAALRGKELRGGSLNDSYKFGDVSRGAISSFYSRKSEVDIRNNKEMKKQDSASYLQENKGRYASIVGSGVGTTVGLSLIGGPIGFVAGSLIGGWAAKGLLKTPANTSEEDDIGCQQNSEQFEPATILPIPYGDTDVGASPNEQELEVVEIRQAKEEYRFGDLTRSVISRGKKAQGRSEDSSYKFGDFTRGFFSS